MNPAVSINELIHSHLTDIGCALIILIYAWDRFNTPPSNRSSTRRALFWQACIGYLAATLALFTILAALLGQQGWADALGLQQKLPAPLLATLAMTTLLPRVPFVNQIDQWLLNFFLDCAAIPAEARRRAAELTPHSFSVTPGDIEELRDRFDGTFGQTFANHLRDQGVSGLERAQLRFTRVVKLYARLQQLAATPRYGRFFAQNGDQFASLSTQLDGFLHGTVEKLDLAARLQAQIAGSAYQELLEERYQSFAEDCRGQFIAMARFLAQAVLRSEASEQDIISRLRRIGFAEAEPMALPVFPINALTGLAVSLFAYLALSGYLFTNLVPHDRATASAPFVMAAKVTLVRIGSLMLCVWLIQRYAFFRRSAGEAPRYFAYLVNGLAGAAVTLLMVACLRLFDVQQVVADLPLVLISLMLCAVTAFCCDDWTGDDSPPQWYRLAEALGCGVTVGLGMFVVVASGLAQFRAQTPFLLAAYIGLPAALGAMIGACVPHIYREARRAAAVRDSEAQRSVQVAVQPALAEPLAAQSTTPTKMHRSTGTSSAHQDRAPLRRAG